MPDGFTLDSYLEHLAYEGLTARYGSTPADAVVERLRYELDVIEKMGFSGYFLVVWDFIAHARRQGIAVGPGPRVVGRLARRVLPRHHQRRPDPVRAASSSDS